jgi:hypothetical protein
MKYKPDAKELNAYTLAETIAEIAKAQHLGDVVCGQIGDIRYSSNDGLTAMDINRMAQKIMDALTEIEVRFKNLEKKARKFHMEAPIPRGADKDQVESIRADMWDSLYNRVNFTGVEKPDNDEETNELAVVERKK